MTILESGKLYLPAHPKNVILRTGERYVYIDLQGFGTIFEKDELPKYLTIRHEIDQSIEVTHDQHA